MRVQRLTAQLLSRVLCIAALASAALPAHAQVPTVDEILQTYRENREKFRTMHVQMTVTSEYTDAYRREKRLKAELYEEILNAVEAGKPFEVQAAGPIDGAMVLNHFRMEATRARLMLNEPSVYRNQEEYFQDGRRYQIRSWSWTSKPAPSPFPNSLVTPESLVTDYDGFNIRSWTEQQTPPGRIWQGDRSRLQLMECEVETRPSGLPAFMGMKFPVTGSDFPAERFFAGTSDNYRVVGIADVEGRPCVILHGILNRDGMQEVSRAWIDMQQGALPRRIQRWRVGGGATFENFDLIQKSTQFQMATTKQITQIDSDCWYPTSVTEEELEPEPEAAMALQRHAAQPPVVPLPQPEAVVFVRRTWHCDLIERNFPHADDFFVLEFGPDHPVVDLDAMRRKKDMDAERPPRLLVKAGQTAPPLEVAKWVNSDKIALHELRGRVVVLLTCTLPMAKEGFVSLAKLLKAKYANKEVDFLMIVPPAGDREKQVKAILEMCTELDWTSPVAIDAGSTTEDSATIKAFGLESAGGVIVIGPNGVVLQNDQEFPEGIHENAALAELWLKNLYTSAGEKWPIPDDMPMEEQKKQYDRVHLFHKSKAIDEGLRKIEGVIPASGTR